jgi:hypothetical protein
VRYCVTFCVELDAENEREALTHATDTIEGYGPADAQLSHTIEELKEEPNGTRTGTQP